MMLKKETFEMVGTSLLVLPRFGIIGLAFLSSSVPLAYESVRQKITNRVMYVEAKFEVVDYRTQIF